MKHHILEIAPLFMIFYDVMCTSPTDWHFMGPNIALHKNATQTPGTYKDDLGSYPASLAVDGNNESYFKNGHCSHTELLSYNDSNHDYAQWMVDLGGSFSVTGVIIFNRWLLRERLNGFMVFGYNEKACQNGWCKIYGDNGMNRYYKIEIKVEPVHSFSKVAIKLPKHNSEDTALTLCEVEIFGAEVCEYISISHGFLHPNTTTFKVNTSANVRCDEGYQPNIQNVACNRNIHNVIAWDNHPECIIINCTSPGMPSNGYYLKDSHVVNSTDVLPFGSIIYGRCNLGYKNENNERRICQSDKTWSGCQPICKTYSGHVANVRPVEDDAQGQNAALYGGVSAVVVLVIIINVLVLFFIYRRTKNRSNQTGGPHIYTDLLRSDNNQESLAQDHVYSAVRESRISSITEMASSASPSDKIYINLTENETDKNTLKDSNQSSEPPQGMTEAHTEKGTK